MNEYNVDKLKSIEDSWCHILDTIDPNWKIDDNLRETPRRIAKSLTDRCRGKYYNTKYYEDLLSIEFCSSYDGIVKVGPIQVFSLCPHHFESVSYSVVFGYMPNKSVVGLSKIPRFIKAVAAQPILQEEYTKKLVHIFQSVIDTFGIIAIVKGQHNCMMCRGVEVTSECYITTSSVFGCFKESDSIKQEFLRM